MFRKMELCGLQSEAGGLAKGGERIVNCRAVKLSLAKVQASAARKCYTRLVLNE